MVTSISTLGELSLDRIRTHDTNWKKKTIEMRKKIEWGNIIRHTTIDSSALFFHLYKERKEDVIVRAIQLLVYNNWDK